MGNLSSKRYLIKNSISTFFRVGVSSISTLLITPFIIKNIGLSLFGYISLTSFFVSYAGLFDIGISKALVFLLNEDNISEQNRSKYISTFYYINIIIISIIFSIGAIGIGFSFPILGSSIPPGSEYYLLMTIVSVLILCLSIFNMLQCAILEAYFKLEKANYGIMLKIMILNLLYLLNMIWYNNLSIYILSSLISVMIATCYYSIVIRRTIRINFVRICMADVKRIFKVSFSFAGVGIFSSLNSALPMLAVTYFTNGLANIAILNVVNRLSMSIVNLGGSLSRPFFALTKKNPDSIRNQWKKVLLVYSIGGGICILIVILFRNSINNYFFHESDLLSLLNYMLIIYVVAAVVYLIGQSVSMYLMGIGKAVTVTKIIACNSFIFLITYFILNQIFDNVLINLSIANILMALSYTISLIFNSIKR
mgnify:CR=1 FL=1